jgi:histidyl-tRNA synthetase
VTERLKTPRGTRDLSGEEVAVIAGIEDAARALAIHYGFEEIRTPIFESQSLFERSVGDETDIVAKELYRFVDRKGRPLALRPEGTAGVVRAYIEHAMAARGGATKLYYAGPMFRYERPQGGRYRQFLQIGFEFFGATGVTADFEIIDLAWRLLERLSVKAGLRVNHLGCAACREAFSRALVDHFAARREALCGDCVRRLEKKPLRLLDCKVPACRAIAGDAPSIGLCATCRAENDVLHDLLRGSGIAFTADATLVRGLDYYTGIVFEMTSAKLGAQDAVLGGGRYDNLVADLGGAAVPAVGFAVGVDRLASIILAEPAASPPRAPLLYVIGLKPEGLAEAARLTRILRRWHEKRTLAASARPDWIEMGHGERSLKARLKEADRLGAAYVAIIGEDEVANGTTMIREMGHGGQAVVALRELKEGAIGEAILATMERLTEERLR